MIPARPADSDRPPGPSTEAIEAQREQRIRAMLVRANLPARHVRVEAQRIGPGEDWSGKLASLTTAAGSGFLIALLGERGTGKTQLAVELVRHVCRELAALSAEDRAPAFYSRAIEIFMAIKAAYHRDGPTESEQIAKFARPDLLVIDEAHERGETEWENRLLTHLIDRRYADLKDTLLVSNQQPEAFKASIGPSIYNRLVETGGVIVCDWPSFRQPK